jgi:hypothetical protein
MKKIFLITFLLVTNLVNAQNHDFVQYKRLKNLAHTSDSLEDYSSAIAYYDSMFTTIDFYPYDYFNAFQSAWKLEDSLKANDYLINGALKGLDISGWYGKEIDEFRTRKVGVKYLAIKDSLLLEHYKSIDKVYFDELEKLVILDQQKRDKSPEMFYQDSLNFEALIQLTVQRGFPTFPTTGYGCSKAWLLLWHHRVPEYPDSNQWRRIIPYIQHEIDNGNLDPDFLEMHEKSKKGEW